MGTKLVDVGKIDHIKKTIDFIIIKEKYKQILQNSIVYRVKISDSDHNILVRKMNLTRSFIFSKINRKTTKKSQKYKTKCFTNDIKVRKQYQTEVNKCLEDTLLQAILWKKSEARAKGFVKRNQRKTNRKKFEERKKSTTKRHYERNKKESWTLDGYYSSDQYSKQQWIAL